MTLEPEITFCSDCDHVVVESRKKHPALWLCIRFPRAEGQGFVSRTAWADEEPYNRCVNINKGYCPLWTPIRNGASSQPDANSTPAGIQQHRLERI